MKTKKEQLEQLFSKRIEEISIHGNKNKRNIVKLFDICQLGEHFVEYSPNIIYLREKKFSTCYNSYFEVYKDQKIIAKYDIFSRTKTIMEIDITTEKLDYIKNFFLRIDNLNGELTIEPYKNEALDSNINQLKKEVRNSKKEFADEIRFLKEKELEHFYNTIEVNSVIKTKYKEVTLLEKGGKGKGTFKCEIFDLRTNTKIEKFYSTRVVYDMIKNNGK